MKNLNADSLLDIWADLKAKRLAPVAIGLLVVAVAMPALMLRGEETPEDAPLPIAAPASADAAKVEVAEELTERGSKLESYKARDPFDGLVTPKDESSGASGTAVAPGDAAGAGTKPDSGSSPVGSGDAGAGGGGSTDTDGGSGGDTVSPGGGGNDAPKIVKRPRSQFTYQLDVKFGRPGREKRYPNLSRLSFLPSAKLPTLLFMGVPEAAKSALFVVHAGLNHQGQGKCIPSRSRCHYLELGVGKEHYVSANDREFRIRLLDIKRVKLSAVKKSRAAARRSARTNRSARTGDGAGGSDGGDQQFEPPLLADGVG